MSETLPSEPSLQSIAERLAALEQRSDEALRLVREIRELVGPFGAPMPEGRMLVQTLHGLKYLIDPSDLIMAPQLIIYRQWEPDLSALFVQLLGPDSVVIDVGANFGYFTCLAASRIGASAGGRVLSIEPNPRILELLRANVAINWSMAPVEVLPFAAGETHGAATLWAPANRAANASLSTQVGGDAIEIAMRPLDSLTPPGLAVTLLKIDVEGHEAGALRGARRVIADSPDIIIVIEWSIDQMTAAGETPQTMLRLLDELGLVAHDLPADGDLQKARPLAPETLAHTPYANLILRRSAD